MHTNNNYVNTNLVVYTLFYLVRKINELCCVDYVV